MTRLQESAGTPERPRRTRWTEGVAGPLGRWSVCCAAALLMVGCVALDDATMSPEQQAAEQPQRVTTEGAKDEFPNLSEVPSGPQPHTPPEARDQMVAELSADRDNATFTEVPPLETAASADPFANSLIISSGSVTRGDQVAALEPQSSAGDSGQLAAIIFFSHGSVDLDGNDRDVLRDLVTLHQQRGGSLRVVGHASSRTRNATPDEHQVANFEMSLKRADAVSAELRRLGVSGAALKTEARSDAEPVYHEFMPSGEAGNRRVEIFLEN
ncbi:OmpA family protein [Pelagibius sp.]|uniref:OmpA family protein n=1 Tax=Pelagibius sp. TaxID=1931238 RepID=UPI003B5039BC